MSTADVDNGRRFPALINDEMDRIIFQRNPELSSPKDLDGPLVLEGSSGVDSDIFGEGQQSVGHETHVMRCNAMQCDAPHLGQQRASEKTNHA